jgi:hypothetical protein
VADHELHDAAGYMQNPSRFAATEHFNPDTGLDADRHQAHLQIVL